MSLIITSSKQDRYGGQNAIESPYSYKNYLGNAMKIKPHSEVAVQSVKIERSGSFVFHDHNKQAYLMVGTDIDAKDEDLINHRPTTLIPVSIRDGIYTGDQLAKELTDAFTTAYSIHPDLHHPVITLKKTLGVFLGFNFDFKQKTVASIAEVKADAAWFPRPMLDTMGRDMGSGHGLSPSFYRNKASSFENITQAQFEDPTFVPDWWDNAAKTITRVDTAGTIDDGGGHSYIGGVFPQYPISHQGGVLKFAITNCNDTEWVCGITRPVACGSGVPEGKTYDDGEAVINLYGNGEMSVPSPPWAEDADTSAVWKFGDYMARSIQATDGKHYLRLFYFGHHIGSQVDASGTKNDLKPNSPLRFHSGEGDVQVTKPDDPVSEVPYWVSTTTGYGKSAEKTKLYDLDTNSLGFDSFQWKVENEMVIFSGFKGAAETVFASYAVDNATGFPNAGSPNRFTMYPKVLLRDTSGGGNTKSIKLESFTCRTDMVATHAATSQPWAYGSDYYAKTMDNRVSEDLDRRPMNDVDWMAAVNTQGTAPKGVEGGGASVGMLGYNAPYIMMSDDARIKPSFVKRPYANLGPIAGFENINYIGGGIDAADLHGGAWDADTKKLTFASAHVPKMEAEHSLFIRCPTLTQQCQNFSKGAISKILYHLPQFTPDGRSTGALFFEPHEKTYIKLGNTETIDLNELQIDLVDKNENLAYELEGSTIVVLHIR
tara:strand:+ start:5493 stop:7631 length:2139 start_codon:yes stop_codon:yes gene_type:complete